MRVDLNLYTLKERIFFVKNFYKNDCDVSSVKINYVTEFGSLADIPDSLIFDVVELFEETGSVREVSENVDYDVIQEFTLETVDNDEEPEEEKKEIVDHPDVFLYPETGHINQRMTEFKKEPSVEENVEVKSVVEEEVIVDEPEMPSGEEKEPGRTKKKKFKRFISKREREQSNFNCEICGRKMVNKNGLHLHMIHLHVRKEGLTCEYCHKSIRTMYELRVHKKLNHKDLQAKERPLLKCPQCPKTYSLASILKKHMLKHSDVKSEICEICGKSFKSRSTLKHHKTIHTGEKKFKCDFPDCERAFRDKNSSEIHKRTHTGEKPFPCEYCGKGFSDKTTLKIHYRQHTGENPYTCELCGKKTKQIQNLRSHMRHFHKIQNPK